MTVAELITLLGGFPAGCPVYVRGYESGLHLLEPSYCGRVQVVIDYDLHNGYGGPDMQIEDGYPSDEEIRELGCPVVSGILIDRCDVEGG